MLFVSGIATAVILGAAIGLGMFTFVHARGTAYLGNDPAACANCHVMEEHFAAWRKSSHHAAATCNDCHAPPGGLAKYWVKAVNGFNHSYAFTTGDFVEPIRITARNREVTEARVPPLPRRHRGHERQQAAKQPGTCLHCHASVYTAYRKAGGGDLIAGFEKLKPAAVRRGAQARGAPDRVHRRLHRDREQHGLPRARRGRAHPRRLDRSRPPGPALPARCRAAAPCATSRGPGSSGSAATGSAATGSAAGARN